MYDTSIFLFGGALTAHYIQVLAALDVHTGRWIVDKCFMGDLIRGRTVILVVRIQRHSILLIYLQFFWKSHNVALTRPIADLVVALGNDGRIVSQGSLDKALQADSELYEELKAEVEDLPKADQVVDNTAKTAEDSPKDGKLVVAEEISTGRVGWNACERKSDPCRAQKLTPINHSAALLQEHGANILVILEYLLHHTFYDTRRHQRSGMSTPLLRVHVAYRMVRHISWDTGLLSMKPMIRRMSRLSCKLFGIFCVYNAHRPLQLSRQLPTPHCDDAGHLHLLLVQIRIRLHSCIEPRPQEISSVDIGYNPQVARQDPHIPHHHALHHRHPS